jgi:Putative Actinobacterial Holin-X, holin superfamily III
VAILQALFRLIARSAGSAVNAIFGWAVIALFGQTTAREQTILSALVGAAAAWPLLLVGVALPKIALLVVAFVPLAKSVPAFWLRIVWIGLALLVPIVVGIVVAARGSKEHLPEPWWMRLARGFPITLALALSFLLMMVVAPILKIATIVRRREIVRLPALMDKGATAEAALALVASLEAHGMRLVKAKAPWHMTAPSQILLKIGGRAFSSMASSHVEFHKSPELAVAVLPNETILDGKSAEVGRAHAFCTEVYAPRRVTQTFTPGARELEMRIQRLWSIYRDQPQAHRESPILRARLAEVAAELTTKTLPWDEYQTIYRLLLQLDRALAGKPPLLDKVAPKQLHQEKKSMATEKIALPSPRSMQKLPAYTDAVTVPVEGMSNRELIGHVVDSATLLAKKEIELAKTELRKDLKAEVSMAKGLGIAGVCALCTLNMFLVAGAFALAHVVADWAAALIVAAAVLAVGTIAGTVGWKKRVTSPLESTRRSLKEDARWARERLA